MDTATGDRVQVLWRNGERWGASGLATLTLDETLDDVASEPVFWIHA